MNKTYKIFGAAAIIGLFLIGSMSTGLAAVKQTQPQAYPYGAELMTDKQEAQYGLQPAPAIFCPDLITMSVSVENRLTGKYLVIDILNDGRSMLLYHFWSHVEVQDCGPNTQLEIESGLGFIWLRGQTKSFSVRIPFYAVGIHDVQVTVDNLNMIFEGIGELNNYHEFENINFWS